jgi:hypothetical protein
LQSCVFSMRRLLNVGSVLGKILLSAKRVAYSLSCARLPNRAISVSALTQSSDMLEMERVDRPPVVISGRDTTMRASPIVSKLS